MPAKAFSRGSAFNGVEQENQVLRNLLAPSIVYCGQQPSRCTNAHVKQPFVHPTLAGNPFHGRVARQGCEQVGRPTTGRFAALLVVCGDVRVEGIEKCLESEIRNLRGQPSSLFEKRRGIRMAPGMAKHSS